MKMKKILTGFTTLALSTLLLAACGGNDKKDTASSSTASSSSVAKSSSSKEEAKETKKVAGADLKDGTYKLEEKNYEHGYRTVFSITVKDGKIIESNYDNVNEKGESKTKDADYNKNMKAKSGTDPETYTPQLNKELVEGQNANVAVVTGATHSSESFKNYAQQLIQAAQAGKTDTIEIDNGAALKDGTYTLEEKNYSHNYRVVFSITVKDGKLTESKYDYVDKDGKSKQDDEEYNKSMQENTQGAIENLLIDTFMASLLDDKNFHDTTRPLDVPVNIMKNDIVKKYFGTKSSNLPLMEYTEEYQDMLKQDFADSKSGIGPFALNNPHHVLGQLVELTMNAPEHLSHFKNLHGVTGVDGIHILDWLSALISAHVDVAKDNYIIKLNVNSFTYNMINLCIRAGAGKNTMFFVSQQIIKELADSYIQSKGTYAMDKSKSFYRRYQDKEKEILQKFTELAKKSAKNKEQMQAVDALLKNNKISDSILFEVPQDGKLGFLENLLNKAKDNNKDYDYYYGQLLVYQLFKELDPLSKSLSNLVKASQIDTKKFGKNAIQMNQFLYNLNKLYSDPYFSNEMLDKFFNKTFLQRKLDNSVNFTLNLLSDVNIQSKPDYHDIFRSLLNCAGLSNTSDERFTTTLTNAIDAYWRSVALYPDSNSELLSSLKSIRDLFFGNNTIAKRLNNLKKDILNDASTGGNKYTMITVANGRISNLFLNSISGMTDSSGKNMDYIRLDYSDSVSSSVSRQMREYWKELLDSDVPELRDFARDLVKYAIFNGHGSKHLNALFDFIPSNMFEELGYYDFVRGIEDDTNTLKNLLTEDDVDEIFRNNWQDNTLVPVINTSNKNVYLHRETIGGKQKLIAIKGTTKRPICNDIDDKPLYHPYVKIRNKNSTGGYDLYKFIGVFEKAVGNKFEYKPLYILVNKKGIRESGKGVVTEYMSASTFGDVKKSRYSVVPGNNVAPTFASYDNNFLEDCPDLLNNIIIPRVNSQTKKNDAPGKSGQFIPLNTIRYMFRFDMDTNNNTNSITEEMDENGDIVQNVEGLKDTSEESKQITIPTTRKTYSGMITSLKPNQIFVFGSNTQGRHGKGAALTAKNKFGAVYGQSEGPQGQSYAIITKDLTKKTHPSRTPEQVKEQIHNLYEYARQNPDKEFLVAYSGTGANLNAYSNQEMADMFASESIPNNIVFEEGFDKLIQEQSTEETTVPANSQIANERISKGLSLAKANAGEKLGKFLGSQSINFLDTPITATKLSYEKGSILMLTAGTNSNELDYAWQYYDNNGNKVGMELFNIHIDENAFSKYISTNDKFLSLKDTALSTIIDRYASEFSKSKNNVLGFNEINELSELGKQRRQECE